MKYGKIVEGKFIDRPNRFIAHVEIEGREAVAHVKNTGRCRELLTHGAVLYLQDWGDWSPCVSLETADPAKFPDAVEAACGERPALPAFLGDLMQRPERMSVLPNDLAAIETFVRQRARILA